jgi:hypothetical protein
VTKTFPTFLPSALFILTLLPASGGCALFGFKQAADQRKAYEAQLQQQQVAVAEAQKESERQIAIARARTEYLQEELDAQVYGVECPTLSADIEKVVVKMGRSLGPTDGGLLVTEWSHVQARYEADYWAYQIRQTQAASRSRYVVELEPTAEGAGCRVEATFQYADDNGREASDRALDFEARVLQEVDPGKYADVEAKYESIGG